MTPIEWKKTVAVPPLMPEETVIWRMQLPVDRASELDFWSVLDEFERRRAGSIKNRCDRRAFVVSRAALKCILGAYIEQDPAHLRLQYNEYGKPCLPQISFNVTHSKNLALIAAGWTHPLGIDAEWKGREVRILSVARRYFAASEVLQIENAETEALARDRFFALWTRKEAYAKATGRGLFRELTNFEVPLGKGQAYDRSSRRHHPVCSFCPADGYIAAVCAANLNAKMSAYDIPSTANNILP